MSDLGSYLAITSTWIDTSELNAKRDPEAQLWGRVAKVAEESGEAIQALIAVTGQNPRKGAHMSMDDVRTELLDVALTALAAYEHMTGNKGSCMKEFENHVIGRMRRVGLLDPNE